MADRLNRITTRTGDGGRTRLADGSEVAKHDPRTEAMGSLDELNSQLGVLLATLPGHPLADSTSADLQYLQHRLFDLGSALAMPGHGFDPKGDETDWLGQRSKAVNAELPPLTEFLLPGGHLCAAQCQLARAVCRRAERRYTQCLDSLPDAAPASGVAWLNRLSDYLFILGRALNRATGTAEPVWQPAPPPGVPPQGS